ncbi:Phospholipase A and acyltransferase 3, partial [Biomphalaria glabrata]
EHENQLSEGGETELPYLFEKCAKNPGHREFYRASDFTLYNLPEGHRDSLVFDLVQSLANLTVKLKVNFTSENRPEF